MLGAEYKWLFSLASAGGRKHLRLARHGLLTLVLAIAFAGAALTAPTPDVTRLAVAAAPAPLKVESETAAPAWFGTALFFLNLVPQLLPHDH